MKKRKIDLTSILQRASAGVVQDVANLQKSNVARAKLHVSASENRVRDAREQKNTQRAKLLGKDKEQVMLFIEEVAGKIVDLFSVTPSGERRISEGNGLKIVIHLSKTDNGPFSIQILDGGKPCRTMSNNTIKEIADTKSWKDEKLLEQLENHSDGWQCATEAEMMQEIIRLRCIIEGMSALADAKREARNLEEEVGCLDCGCTPCACDEGIVDWGSPAFDLAEKEKENDSLLQSE